MQTKSPRSSLGMILKRRRQPAGELYSRQAKERDFRTYVESYAE
jgi:hypothetical protein